MNGDTVLRVVRADRDGSLRLESHLVRAWRITEEGDLYLTKRDGARAVIARGHWVEVEATPTSEKGR